MIKRVITYTDYNGESQSEEFWFHLNNPEILSLQIVPGYDLENYMTKLVRDQKASDVMAFFEKVILTAYGERSLDGKRFDKNAEATENFKHSAAYNQLFYDLVTNAEEAGKFMNALVSQPQKVGNPANQ